MKKYEIVVSFTARPLYFMGKSPRYPLIRRLDGFQVRSEGGLEEKNICLCREPNPVTFDELLMKVYTTHCRMYVILFSVIFCIRLLKKTLFVAKVSTGQNVDDYSLKLYSETFLSKIGYIFNEVQGKIRHPCVRC
jgi:hypothetical protein